MLFHHVRNRVALRDIQKYAYVAELEIQVDQSDFFVLRGERAGKADGHGGLSYAAFSGEESRDLGVVGRNFCKAAPAVAVAVDGGEDMRFNLLHAAVHIDNARNAALHSPLHIGGFGARH